MTNDHHCSGARGGQGHAANNNGAAEEDGRKRGRPSARVARRGVWCGLRLDIPPIRHSIINHATPRYATPPDATPLNAKPRHAPPRPPRHTMPRRAPQRNVSQRNTPPHPTHPLPIPGPPQPTTLHHCYFSGLLYSLENLQLIQFLLVFSLLFCPEAIDRKSLASVITISSCRRHWPLEILVAPYLLR